ncbi:MAG: hypothetical protein KME45_23205 [Stenomitos rutilans HA7619-LM2]|jgi:hypothetical protein|nr:hypothetical protein [Stenomitos rutilans HA7619-LM2]
MNDTKLTPINREEVFKTASRYLEANSKVPSLPSIRSEFETPTSPSIAVYLREWKEAHADDIANCMDTKQSWRAKATRLEQHCLEVSKSLKDIANELADLNDWLATNHPGIHQEYLDYGKAS